VGHFAKVINGVVTRVIVAEPEFFDTFVDSEPGEWVQTSYNTYGGAHYDRVTGKKSKTQDKALRKNYAGIGFCYDKNADAFYSNKPFNSWALNEETFLWEPPTPCPVDGKVYFWNEELLQWVNPEGE
jgi:hypothetical protein